MRGVAWCTATNAHVEQYKFRLHMSLPFLQQTSGKKKNYAPHFYAAQLRHFSFSVFASVHVASRIVTAPMAWCRGRRGGPATAVAVGARAVVVTAVGVEVGGIRLATATTGAVDTMTTTATVTGTPARSLFPSFIFSFNIGRYVMQHSRPLDSRCTPILSVCTCLLIFPFLSHT